MKDTSSPLSAEHVDGEPLDHSLRPQSLSDFTGQPQVIENLSVFIKAAKARSEALDHALLYGPNIEAAQKILVDVLGFFLVEHVEIEENNDLAIWLSCSTKAHDIAFVRHAEPGKFHHVAFLLESWEKVLRAADIMSMNRVQIDIGPTRHGITRGTTIYAFDPSGNRFETFSGGYSAYPDWAPIKWTMDEVGRGIFYHDRKLNEAFLSVVT